MKIIIDGKPLDITLEAEKTLSDILAALESWFTGSGLVLSGIALNGQKLSGKELNAGVFDTAVETISELALYTSSISELCLEALYAAQEMLEAAKQANADEKNNFLQTWKESAGAAFLYTREPEIYKKITETFEGKTTTTLETTIKERRQELEQPETEFISLGSCVQEIKKRLESFALDMQMGHDKSARDTIADFSALCSKLLRLIPILRCSGIVFEQLQLPDGFFEEFNAALKEFFDAYENGDTVLSGDLAEYEVAPRMEALYNAVKDSIETKKIRELT